MQLPLQYLLSRPRFLMQFAHWLRLSSILVPITRLSLMWPRVGHFLGRPLKSHFTEITPYTFCYTIACILSVFNKISTQAFIKGQDSIFLYEPLYYTLHTTNPSSRRTATCLWQIEIIGYQGMASLHYLLIIKLLLGSVIGESQIVPELFLNKVSISYGINYKYNDQLNHNIDRYGKSQNQNS